MASSVTDKKLWQKQFPLRTKGRYILNQYGDRFKFSGVNWYGASDAIHVVCGLTTRPLNDICEGVATMGFTVVRLPFSNEMLRTSEVPSHAIDFTLNPQLKDKTPLEVYDAVIDCLGLYGVAVVLNNHTTVGMWSGGVELNGLWFLEGSVDYTENSWIIDWIQMAKRYENRPWVVGYDLRNEVRPVSLLRKSKWPLWGRLGNNQNLDQSNSVDWRRASGRCADALVSGGFPGLIIVERLAWPQDPLNSMLSPSAPWEPNLTSADIQVDSERLQQSLAPSSARMPTPDEVVVTGSAVMSSSCYSVTSVMDEDGSCVNTVTSTYSSSTLPTYTYDTTPSGWHKVPKDRVVLALHTYAWSGPGAWSPRHFTGGVIKSLLSARDWMSGLCLYGEYETEASLEKQMDEEFGWVLQQDICPVWLSEFGCDVNSDHEMAWFRKLCAYMEKRDVEFAYWPLNVGMKPVPSADTPTSHEGYGLLTNDWSPRWHDERLRLLRQLIPPKAKADIVSSSKQADSDYTPAGSFNTAPLSLYFSTFGLSRPKPPPAHINTKVPLVMMPLPWCYPLPGPLVHWPSKSGKLSHQVEVDSSFSLPKSKYDWKRMGKRPSQINPERVDQAKRRCISGGFGGFIVDKGNIIYQNTTSENLYVKAMEGMYRNAEVYICYELKLCANERAAEESTCTSGGSSGPASSLLSRCNVNTHSAHSIVSIGLESYEAKDVFVEENAKTVQFDTHHNIIEHVSSASSSFYENDKQSYLNDNIDINKVHGYRSVNFGVCKRLCLEGGFGGFAVDGRDGTAYFRSCNDGSVLRKGLVPAAKHTTFYIFSVSKYESDNSSELIDI